MNTMHRFVPVILKIPHPSKIIGSTANGLATGYGAAFKIPRVCHCYSSLSPTSAAPVGLKIVRHSYPSNPANQTADLHYAL